jgi:lysine 2,3-aminomutase
LFYYYSVSRWKEILEDSLTTPIEVASSFGLDPDFVSDVVDRYPVLINSYYRRLCEREGLPIIRQVLPDPVEISAVNVSCPEDPVGEDIYAPVPNLTHRYKDRVLFLVSSLCPIYCRFCTRKRKVGRSLTVTSDDLRKGFAYIADHAEIRDVLLSGGDPLMLEDGQLAVILERLQAVDHIEIMRIGTRVPAALPQRITPELVSILSNNRPIYVHTHFNHRAEITEESREACRLLADAGIPLSNQTVLLRGVNDDPDTLEELFRTLLTIRVRPYYLFQVDLVRGAQHFRIPLFRGIEIMEELRRRTSPMALPTFAVDLPESAGKAFPCVHSVLNLGRVDQAVVTPEGDEVPYPDSSLS